ncbi:hypothetical protein CUS_5052 [Ruminococcus albus 8]|uniref:Uncharacterized protein n=2 Tax=Ruminococcus albus TaxID=1264 RepID=E9SD99_RUMAL|nr:hypothetical protein CUS_5052 [Ruminococcus albus 8]
MYNKTPSLFRTFVLLYKKYTQKRDFSKKEVLSKKSYHKSKNMCYNTFTTQRKAQKGECEMSIIFAAIVLVINEYSTREGWFASVTGGLLLAGGLIWAATVSPARTFILCVMGLCALLALELERISDIRKEAGKKLNELDDRDAERNARNARRGLRVSSQKSVKRKAA